MQIYNTNRVPAGPTFKAGLCWKNARTGEDTIYSYIVKAELEPEDFD